jgi:predicted metal-binding membrane protein
MLRPSSHHHGGGVAASLGQWLVMTVAMMLPMVVQPMRTTAERSLWRRRHRAIGGFLFGYLGCWMITGLLASLLPAGYRYAGAMAFVVAAAWQLTRQKRIALAGCHWTAPLAPAGWTADLDCIRYGARIGVRCVGSCWALMLACALTGHVAAGCVGMTAIGLVERYARHPHQRLLSGALVAAAITSFVAA